MTVVPIQDLIVDVMAAADPVAQRMAAAKLERAAAGSDQDFAAEINQKIEAAAQKSETLAARGSQDLPMDRTGHAPMIKSASGSGEVYRKFEAFVLQMFVESMLPKDATNVFGKGTAGTIWRSMLAEQISNEMVKGDGVGIAKQLAKSRPATDAAET